MNFTQLVNKIETFLGQKGLDDLSDLEITKLKAILNTYKSNPTEWQQYAFYDEHKYTRNLVSSGNGKYNLIILCWGPNQYSPIHSHGGSHCLMKVLDNVLEETLYSNDCEKERVSKVKCDDTVYINDEIGLHKVGNPSELNSVSLHLYTPPIKQCSVFDSEGKLISEKATCCFYSKFGQIK